MQRYEHWIVLFVVLVVAMLAIAAIGYFTGAWETAP